MADVVSIGDARAAARRSYLDVDALCEACDRLEACVMDITSGSMKDWGAIDPIAFEINAHVVAIRRALAVASIKVTETD